MTYEEQLNALQEAIEWCDRFLENAEFDKMEGDMDSIDTVLDRRAQLLKMQATTKEMLDNDKKMKSQNVFNIFNWIKDAGIGAAAVIAPLWLHNRQFNQLAEIEKWDLMVRTPTGKGLISKMGQLLNFKK